MSGLTIQKIVSPEATIKRAGIVFGGVYQNLHWLESPPDYFTICKYIKIG